MDKILITGITGQVGYELMRQLAPLGEVIGLSRQQLDLTDSKQIQNILNLYQPTIIVNCAAYTAVDKAELEAQTAYQVNQDASQVMAKWAAQHDALLIHYSTDYVFDGTKTGAYLESDIANPQSVYGHSKYLGEEAIRDSQAKHFILRTSWVYGLHGHNFIKTIFRLANEREQLRIVADQHGAPTSAMLIAKVTAQLIQSYRQYSVACGTYHLCAAGCTTWYEYARFVVQTALQQGMTLKLKQLEAISSSEYLTPAIRPKNSRLNCNKLSDALGVKPSFWQDDVKAVITQLIKQ
jgi:dTDP-4-dehydrorhamnose reductase